MVSSLKAKDQDYTVLGIYSRISNKFFGLKLNVDYLRIHACTGMQDSDIFLFTQILFHSINIDCVSTKCRNCARC